MNKKLITALLLLTSSISYAQTDNKKTQSKQDSFISELPSVPKLNLPKIPSLYPPKKIFYNYSINVEKLTKNSTVPIMLYKSSGSGVSDNIVSYSTIQHIPYVKECNTNTLTNEVKCSTDNLNVVWEYSINASSSYNNEPCEFWIRVSLGDLLSLNNEPNNMVKDVESRAISLSQSFYYEKKKKTFVFKSYSNPNNKESDEYIFTVTIEPNKN